MAKLMSISRRAISPSSSAWLTRIMPHLTVWAAAGLLAIQPLAITFHAVRGEFEALPFNLIYVALAVFVLWGRARKAPITPRA